MFAPNVVLATVAGLFATTPDINAVSAPNTQMSMEASGGIPRISDAAREQILDKSGIQLAAVKKPRPFVQENGPSFVQWRAQVRAQMDSPLPAPSGDVAVVFRNLNIS
jgi:hypothetical protein